MVFKSDVRQPRGLSIFIVVIGHAPVSNAMIRAIRKKSRTQNLDNQTDPNVFMCATTSQAGKRKVLLDNSLKPLRTKTLTAVKANGYLSRTRNSDYLSLVFIRKP